MILANMESCMTKVIDAPGVGGRQNNLLRLTSVGPWETRAMVFILAVSLLVQGNALLHHGYVGQDYGFHSVSIQLAQQSPHWWVYSGTDAPLFYWLGAFVHYITLSDSYEPVLCLIVVLLNIAGLYLWFKLSRSMMRSPLMRIGTLITLTFLPFRLIHSEVLAADGLAVVPFTLVLFLFTRLLHSRNSRGQSALVLLVSAALLVGILTKYTLFSAIPAAAALLIYFRRKFANLAIWVFALLMIVAVPAATAVAEYRQFRLAPVDAEGNYKPQWRHDMQWRNLLFVTAADRDILHAPAYDETINVSGQPTFNLLISNRHSYPALLHLSVFTDIMNVFQYDPTDRYIGPRTAVNQRLMAISVKSAVLLSAWTVIAVMTYAFRMLIVLWRDRTQLGLWRYRNLAVVLGFSLAYFGSFVVFLPYVGDAYYVGYWLSRLVMQPLLGFVFIGFAFLDEYVKSRAAQLIILAYAIAQSALHLSFLWPRGP